MAFAPIRVREICSLQAILALRSNILLPGWRGTHRGWQAPSARFSLKCDSSNTCVQQTSSDPGQRPPAAVGGSDGSTMSFPLPSGRSSPHCNLGTLRSARVRQGGRVRRFGKGQRTLLPRRHGFTAKQSFPASPRSTLCSYRHNQRGKRRSRPWTTSES